MSLFSSDRGISREDLMEPIIETLRKGVEQLALIASVPDDLESILVILAGATLLLFGRKLYWFVIAAAGFAVGSIIGHEVFPPEPEWVMIAAPILVGIVAALLSVFLQKLALRLAGMITGGFLGYTIAAMFIAKPWPLLALLIGCILGFWSVMILFDWALVILSSLSGTALIVQRVPLERDPQLILAVVLLILGIAIQGSLQRKQAPQKTQPKPA
jgi:hypothetical protein